MRLSTWNATSLDFLAYMYMDRKDVLGKDCHEKFDGCSKRMANNGKPLMAQNQSLQNMWEA